MKILIVSGKAHQVISAYLFRKQECVNAAGLHMMTLKSYLQQAKPVFDAVLITDEGLTPKPSDNIDGLNALMDWLEANGKPNLPVIVMTRDFQRPRDWASQMNRYDGLQIIVSGHVRITPEEYRSVLQQSAKTGTNLHTVSKSILHKQAAQEPQESVSQTKKKSFFDRFRSLPSPSAEPAATDRLTRDLHHISRGISRVVAMTGHRGSGLTSTVVNLAHEASKRGLRAIIVDMDTDYRSMNMYFDRFHERCNKDQAMNASLIRTLARPQDYMTTAFNVKDDLWLTSLGYSFHDHRLMEQFYTSEKLIGLITVLKTQFNLVLLDMPLDLFRHLDKSMIHMDLFGLCVPNNLHAVLSTIRNIEVVLDRETASYLNAKSKVIVTKYNDRSKFQDSLFVPEKVSEILTSGLSDYMRYEMKIAGVVPYSSGFDLQIESDIAAVNSGAEYEKAFGQMLLRIMEGA